jgi:HAD superfamily hydrolase (TIGR01490 family)
MKKGKKKVAIFDIDGTIFRSSLLIELVETLIDQGHFKEDVRKKYIKKRQLWIDRRGSYEDYVNIMVEVFLKNIKGLSYGVLKDASDLVVERNSNRVYRFTRDLVKDLKKKKYFLLAVSHSPKAIVDSFCKKLGFDKVYGTLLELGPSEKFTGNLLEEHLIFNKSNILKRAVEKENLTLAGSVGVGDTEGDYTFLELVENPICFNPNSKLLKHAKRNKWRVVVERKDVIYEIKV